MDRIGVGLIGFGTVGEGVARLLVEDGAALTERTGLTFDLRHVIDVDIDRPRLFSFVRAWLADSTQFHFAGVVEYYPFFLDIAEKIPAFF